MSSTHLRISDALAQLEAQAQPRFIELFRHGTLTVELYAPRGRDAQTPHTRDEVYVIVSGMGVFYNGEKRVPIVPGDFLFVAAGRLHRFEEFTPDFAAWVMFYGPEGGERESADRESGIEEGA
ncbi:MAG: cupin domain-containing protein [Longimicrobiales bacterium]